MKLSRAQANRVLPREYTSHSKHPLPTTQEKILHKDITMVNTKIKLIVFFAVKDGELDRDIDEHTGQCLMIVEVGKYLGVYVYLL